MQLQKQSCPAYNSERLQARVTALVTTWPCDVLVIVGAYNEWKTHLGLINFLQQPRTPVTAPDLCQRTRKRSPEDIQHFTLDKSEGIAQRNPGKPL